MQNYSGNREPFLYVYLSKADEAAGRALVDALHGAGHRLYVSSDFTARDRGVLRKAAAAVLFLSSASVEELSPAVSCAAKEDKPLIPVYLDQLTLPAGMRMLLGPKQAHARANFADDASFAEALLASPVLRDLKVTPAQKKAARNLLIGALAAAVVVIAAVLLLTLRQGRAAQQIDEASTLSQIGLSGAVSDVKSVCYYGAELRDAFEPYGAQRTESADGSVVIYLPRLDETVAQGMLTDASDFSQLLNLEELAISGNGIPDITPILQLTKLKRLDLSANLKPVSLAGIGALESLEFLNLAYCRIDGDLSELKQLAHLQTLIISQENAPLVDALGDVGFEVLYTEARAADWPSLKAASETPYVYTIDIADGELVIPEGETLTIRKNVLLRAEVPEGKPLVNRGTLVLAGSTRLRMDTRNEGAIVVENGGDWHGAGGDVVNLGSFTVAEGGAHTLALGETFLLADGEYVNNGTLSVTAGSFTWDGGRLVNNGVIVVNEVLPDGTVPLFFGELSEAEGDGEVRTSEGSVDREALQKSKAQLSEEIAALLAMEDDPTDLDQYGMTPKERAVYAYVRSLDFTDFGAFQEELLPIVDTDRLDILQTPRNGNAVFVRDLTLSRAPDCWYGIGGIWGFVVAPGVTVTVEGDLAAWTREQHRPGDGPDDIWFTVMPGGTLIVNGEMPYSLAVNHGDLIVNGRLFSYAPVSQFGDLLGMMANDGTITVHEGGVCVVNQLWSFAGARERGEITFETAEDRGQSRYDFTEHECPFTFEHGAHGFSSFFKYMLDPDGKHDIFTEKFWDWE